MKVLQVICWIMAVLVCVVSLLLIQTERKLHQTQETLAFERVSFSNVCSVLNYYAHTDSNYHGIVDSVLKSQDKKGGS